MFSKCDSKVTRIFIDMIDYQKIHIYISNSFEFGRGNNGFFDMSTSCGEVFGHDIARSDQLQQMKKKLYIYFTKKKIAKSIYSTIFTKFFMKFYEINPFHEILVLLMIYNYLSRFMIFGLKGSRTTKYIYQKGHGWKLHNLCLKQYISIFFVKYSKLRLRSE